MSRTKKHSRLCFSRAFPRTRAEYDEAHLALQSFDDDAGERLRYPFSFDVACWLARTSPGAVSIDWAEFEDTEPLDDLLRQLLHPSEDEYFDSGDVTTREWVAMASSDFRGTDFDWLMARLSQKRLHRVWRQLYDAADVPLVWDLHQGRYSKFRNVFPVTSIRTREEGMRRRPSNVKREIQRPVESISRLSSQHGAKLIDVAMGSLAARHRETYHFNFANPDEVYLADVGEGVGIAVFGLLPGHRFPLECTMGFLILANGAPVGYGGSSLVFRQVNTGINIFDEYRGSEAAFLWVQAMRVYHSLVGCTRYIANPYQFGEGNREALQSGAFWFYYKLGYRPVLPEIRALARDESKKTQMQSSYRSGIRALKKLASCDMHLNLPGARQSEYFDEEWISTSSALATRELGRVGGSTQRRSASLVMESVAKDAGIRSLHTWTNEEKQGFSALAPIVAAVAPGAWSTEAKRSLRGVLRAKGGKRELDYAKRLCRDVQFLSSLQKACRTQE